MPKHHRKNKKRNQNLTQDININQSETTQNVIRLERQDQPSQTPVVEEKPWSWHITQTLSWAGSSVIGLAAYFGLSQLPMVAGTAIPFYSRERTDHTAGDLMKRSLNNPCNNGTQITNWLPLNSVSSALPFFRNMNNSMVAATVGPGTTYQRILVNAFDEHNNPLLPANLAVDAGLWSASAPYVIATPSGPVVCYQTVSGTIQTYFAPCTDDLVCSTGKNAAFWTSYSQKNPRGSGRSTGGFELVFESNTATGSSTKYQMMWKTYGSDNVTPVNLQEIVLSTFPNSDNKHGQVVVNPDDSGLILWAQKINNNYCLVKRSYNIAHNFTDVAEVNLSNTTLPNYDVSNPQPVVFTDGNGQGKILYLASSTLGGNYNIYIQNATFYPTFQLNGNPVNLTANQGISSMNSNTIYSVIPTENNGLMITVSAIYSGTSTQELKISVNPDNTINSITAIDPNTYTQAGSTIVDRGNGRKTIGYQTGSSNGNVVFQTFSEKPFIIRPNSITINELANNQTVSIRGIYVEQTTYPQTQITVTATVSPSVMTLSTSTPLPANAVVNYDSASGTLTLTTSGSNARDDMNNLLCGLQGDVQAYERQSSDMVLTVSDNSNLPAYNTSLPVKIVTENFTPIVNSAILNIGQNNQSHVMLSVQTVDNVPPEQLTVYVTNQDPSAASVNLVNGSTVNTGITEYTLDQNNQVWIQQLGGNNQPQLQIQVAPYGDTSKMSSVKQVVVNFYPTPQMISRDITYQAKSTDDQTPVPVTNANFQVINSNSPTSAQIFTLTYDSGSHGAIYRKGDFVNPITEFTQADANNVNDPQLYFIPDGSGKTPNLKVGFTDGYNTLPTVPVQIQYTITPPAPANSSPFNWPTIVWSIASAVGVRLFLMQVADGLRYRSDKFANFVRDGGDIGYGSFETTSGGDFVALVNAIADKVMIDRPIIDAHTGAEIRKESVPITGHIKTLLLNYNYFQRYNPFSSTPEEKELKRIASAFASALAPSKDVDEYLIIRIFLYLFLGGLPLRKDTLDINKNTANIQNMANTITNKLNNENTVTVNTCSTLLWDKLCCNAKDKNLNMTVISTNGNNNNKKIEMNQF